jgi:hypothetical protein
VNWFWLVWILTGFAGEMYGVFNKTPNDTLSAFLINHVPVFWIVAAILWALVHFVTRKKGRMRGPEREAP